MTTTNRKPKPEKYQDDLRVLSTTTPDNLLKSVLRGDGFTQKSTKK